MNMIVRRMSRGAALALCLVASTSSAAAAEPAPRYPERTVLLLVASWCAPCYAELARLDEIASAARPLQVRVLLVDDGARSRAMVRGIDAARRWEPQGDEMRRVRADIWQRTAGLPFSVATDGTGRICAEQNGGLDTKRTLALVKRCRSN
jgi:thiol-disulfide isomerase/thioredoxin